MNNHTGSTSQSTTFPSPLNWFKCFSLSLILVQAFRQSITRATFHKVIDRVTERIRRRRQEGDTACATHHPHKGRSRILPTPVVHIPPWPALSCPFNLQRNISHAGLGWAPDSQNSPPQCPNRSAYPATTPWKVLPSQCAVTIPRSSVLQRHPPGSRGALVLNAASASFTVPPTPQC